MYLGLQGMSSVDPQCAKLYPKSLVDKILRCLQLLIDPDDIDM